MANGKMLFTLILKDIRIMYRSIVYSIFEIVIVALLFTLIGYVTIELMKTLNSHGSSLSLTTQSSDSFQYRFCPTAPNCFIYDSETPEESITRLNEAIKIAKVLRDDLIPFVPNGISHIGTTTRYIGILGANQYSTNYWGPGDSMDFRMADAFSTSNPSVYNQYPFVNYIQTNNHVSLKYKNVNYVFPIIQFFIVLVVVNITRNIVHEKATFRQYLVSMGLSIRTYYLAHFLFNYIKCALIFTPGLICFALAEKSTLAGIYLCVSAYLYLIPTITFSFMIASWFKSSKGAILTCLVVWFTLNFMPYFTVGSAPEYVASFAIVLPTCFIFTFNFFYVGLTVSTMAEYDQYSMFAISDRVLPLIALWICLIINAAIMFVIAVLCDEWLPLISIGGLFRRRRGGDATKSRESSTTSKSASSEATGTGTKTGSAEKRAPAGADHIAKAFQDEAHRNTMDADIDIRECVKTYATGETAVNGLTMRAIRGQVSVLLGHNGCGKSSTFSMIAGMSRPTEGSIQVAGYDVVSDRSAARRKIGLCPQYNPLIDKLTVVEHLKIVHSLKNSESPFNEEVEKLLASINLADKRNTLAKNLSGGQKRKLCMLMALIGESCVVLLDEPTAGMDAASRVDVQTMLRETKNERSVLLTTHNMDEAEKLADWVYVMSEGRIEASGTAQFLKTKFGGGWLVTVVVGGEPKKETMTLEDVCRRFVPAVVVKEIRGQMIELNVPADKPPLIEMLKCLEAISEKNYDDPSVASLPNIDMVKQMTISSIGVSLNSLEQVFISIIEQCEKEAKKHQTTEQKLSNLKQLIAKKKESPATGCVSQFIGLALKRLIYFRRNWLSQLLQIAIPLFLLLLIFATKGSPSSHDDAITTSHIDFNLAPPNSIVIIQSDDSSFGKFAAIFGDASQLVVRRVSPDREIADVLNTEQFIRKIAIFIVVENDAATTILINREMSRVATLAVYTKWRTQQPAAAPTSVFEFRWVLFVTAKDSIALLGFYLLILILYTLLVTYNISNCASLHADERVSKFKHQQFLTQMSSMMYWTSQFLWEFVIFTISLFGFGLIMWAFGMLKLTSALMIFGISCLAWFATAPIIFIISFGIESSTKITLLVLIFCFIVPLIKMIADAILSSKSIPFVHFTRWIFPFQPFLTLMILAFLQGHYEGLARAKMIESVGSILFHDDPGMEKYLFDVIMLIFSAIFYTFILFLIANRGLAKSINKLFHSNHEATPKIQLNMEPCLEVDAEKRAILSGQLTPSNTTVLIDNLVKRYGSYQAVNGVFLAVKNGECFGLLGVSGAGKTTMIEILTCKQFACSGRATITGREVDGSVKLGYCPQFDAVLGDFTGRDILTIMAHLQNYRNVRELVELLIDCVGMRGNADKRIKYCSGGQKRKISMGMAIISRRKVKGELIILDEPTAGVDPKARRDLWDIIVGIRAMGEVGIMLTSHSMEECEALCTRIGILRKGDMIALGTHQDLKSKYGNTFTLNIQLNDESAEKRELVQKTIKTHFGDKISVVSDDKSSPNMVWELRREHGEKWSKKMEEIRKIAEQLKIDDYFLVQSSLEDVFMKMNSVNIEKV